MAKVTLRQLEYFVAVAEHGSVTAGAEGAHITQSAMSAALAELEKVLGASLLQRHRRGISLTPAGHVFLGKARQLLADVDDLHATAHEIDGSLRGTLTAGCYSTLAPALMPAAIQGFLDAHPEVDLRFLEGSDEELVDALHQGSCEVAVVYDFGLDRFTSRHALRKTALSGAPPRAIVPTEHPLASKEVVSLGDLAAEPLIMFDLPPAGEYFRGIFEARGLEPRVRFSTESHQLVFGLVAHGLGCAVLTQVGAPWWAAHSRGFVARDLTDDPPPLPIVALSLDGVRPTRRARTFLDHCRTALRPREHPALG